MKSTRCWMMEEEKKIKRERKGVLDANIFSAGTDEIEFRVVFF